MRPRGIRSALLRRGSRTVLLTYPGLRLGNYLYFALHAYLQRRCSGQDYRVLDTGLGDEWYGVFPQLHELLVRQTSVFDRREHIPRLFFQEFGRDFREEELERFVHDVLRPQTLYRPSRDHGSVTVNVRRGDYYASSETIGRFGFDIQPFIRTALNLADAAERVSSVRLVSDDIEWSAAAVAAARPDLADRLEPTVTSDPRDHLAVLASSRRIVLTNSTFSYWGAYLSRFLHEPDCVHVWAPDLHSRELCDGKPWQHDPSWVAIPVSQGASQ